MIANFTAEIFSGFLYGAAGVVGGGILFSSGKRYAKTAGSHQFKGKVEALPFFFGMLVLGWSLEHLDPVVDEFAYSIPPVARLGAIIVGTMLLFNYSIDYFNYVDRKSVPVYIIGGILLLSPTL